VHNVQGLAFKQPGLGSQASLWLHGAEVLWSKFVEATAGFFPPPWGSRYRDHLGWPMGPAVGILFFIIFSKIPSIVCHANAVKPASFSFNIQFCDHMLIVGHVHYVPSLGFNRVLLRLYTHLCNNVVYARVLAVCTMCQAWPSNSLAWALKQASGSMELRFCDQDLFKL
jgi:hypothetical protein